MRLGLALAVALAAAGSPAPAAAGGGPEGAFDYYVLALSWVPGWCAVEGDAAGDASCAPRARRGFILHGLWPQRDPDPPSWCHTGARDPSRAETAAMADIMGSGGLAWYQWKKHGRCSGLTPAAYFAAARRAYAGVRLPEALATLSRPLRITPQVVEQAVLEANPGISAEAVTITCRDGLFQEVRICLTKNLEPRPCGAPVARDCPVDLMTVPPVR
jgi:ribonuclease T2